MRSIGQTLPRYDHTTERGTALSAFLQLLGYPFGSPTTTCLLNYHCGILKLSPQLPSNPFYSQLPNLSFYKVKLDHVNPRLKRHPAAPWLPNTHLG